MLIWIINGQAQDEPEQLSELDRLPTWHSVDAPSVAGRRSRIISAQAAAYSDLDDLIRQFNQGQRIESLVLTGQILGRDAYKLKPLLPFIRVLTLKNLTTGQGDTLLSQIRDWAHLERLTVDVAHLGPGRPGPNRLLSLPTALRQFRHLRDLRIREDGLNWAESLPVLASMTALRRLEIDRWQSQPNGGQQPVLTTLRQLTALHLRNSGWLLTPETLGELPRLTELNLSSLQVDTGTLEKTLNQLTKLETLRLTKCWQVQTLSPGNIARLKTVELAYNDKLNVEAALLAGMTHVERLTIKGAQAIDLTGIGGLRHLQYLNVMGNGQVARLPEAISQLYQLTDLRLYNIRLGSIPAGFGLLRRLQTLHLNYCGLDSLPTTFGRLSVLQNVSLTGNKLQQLTGIEQLIRLQQLNVSGNQLRTLPTGISRLTRLSKLNLSENQLTELPVSLTRLAKLEQLVAEHNQLERLPDQLGQLGSLTDLAVGTNQLTQLPASLGQLTNLTALSAGFNRLESLPDELGQLRKLRFLSLDRNRLSSLPNGIGNLDSLRFLWIGQNQLRALPAGIGQLRSLTELTIDDNELTALPADIGRLQKLTVLSLTKLPITELPASVGALTNLLVLSITDTPLRLLPDSVGTLINLQFVRLTNNKLTTLPNSIGGWQNVTTLDLTGNPLERLPNGIGRMANLTELIIAGKKQVPDGVISSLRQLPDSIVHCDRLQTLTIENQPQLDADDVFSKAVRMKGLSELSVVNCNIVQLPDIDWKKVFWQKLNVAENQLTELPLGLLDAPKLRYISARQNRLPAPLNRDLSVKQALWSAFAEAGKLPLDSTARPNRKLAEALQQTSFEKQSQQDWVGALNALNKAIAYAPDTILATFYANRGRFYVNRKEYTKALADYDTAIVHVPRLRNERWANRQEADEVLATLWQRKAAIFQVMGQYNAALTALKQAEQMSSGKNEWLTARIQVERGRTLTSTGQLQGADSCYRRAIQIYEKLPHAEDIGPDLWIAELDIMTSQYDRARKQLAGMPTEKMRNGYDSWRACLSLCVAILEGSKTGQQALTELKAYRANHPEKVYSWNPGLFENWLTYSRLPADNVFTLRQLMAVMEE